MKSQSAEDKGKETREETPNELSDWHRPSKGAVEYRLSVVRWPNNVIPGAPSTPGAKTLSLALQPSASSAAKWC